MENFKKKIQELEGMSIPDYLVKDKDSSFDVALYEKTNEFDVPEECREFSVEYSGESTE